MNDFDIKISNLVSRDGVSYTRYADDLTFSAKRTGFLTGVERMLRQTIRETTNPTLSLNEAKTVVSTKKYKRFVTGLVLTNDNKVSLGHERKRIIRVTLHHYLLGKLKVEEQARLAGWLAFANGVEPDFIARLELKHGSAIFRQLRSVRLQSRAGG